MTPEEFEMLCIQHSRDSDLIALAPAHLIRQQLAVIEEARERLNDALAKAERPTAALYWGGVHAAH